MQQKGLPSTHCDPSPGLPGKCLLEALLEGGGTQRKRCRETFHFTGQVRTGMGRLSDCNSLDPSLLVEVSRFI